MLFWTLYILASLLDAASDGSCTAVNSAAPSSRIGSNWKNGVPVARMSSNTPNGSDLPGCVPLCVCVGSIEKLKSKIFKYMTYWIAKIWALIVLLIWIDNNNNNKKGNNEKSINNKSRYNIILAPQIRRETQIFAYLYTELVRPELNIKHFAISCMEKVDLSALVEISQKKNRKSSPNRTSIGACPSKISAKKKC